MKAFSSRSCYGELLLIFQLVNQGLIETPSDKYKFKIHFNNWLEYHFYSLVLEFLFQFIKIRQTFDKKSINSKKIINEVKIVHRLCLVSYIAMYHFNFLKNHLLSSKKEQVLKNTKLSYSKSIISHGEHTFHKYLVMLILCWRHYMLKNVFSVCLQTIKASYI